MSAGEILAQLDVLTLEISRLRQLNSVRDPMRRLPPEIASEIFILCLRERRTKRNHIPAISEAPLLFLNICSYWKEVAESTSGLWTDVRLDASIGHFYGEAMPNPEEEKQTMVLYAERYEEFLSRWLLRGRGRASLEMFCGDELIYVIPGIIARNAHHLQSLKLQMAGESYPRAEATHPKSRVDEYVQIFRSASRLKECEIAYACIELGVDSTPSDHHPVVLPALNSLLLTGNLSNAVFAQFLTLPALEELHIPAAAADAGELVSFLARSSPPLRSFGLNSGDTAWPRQTVEDCLALMPNLTNLTLSGPAEWFQDDFIAVLAAAPSNGAIPKIRGIRGWLPCYQSAASIHR
ncbi:hypothetical protein B0H11DRAFT_1915048 [Mycena galericulata]|nr:hypothetical protein B0H11DRAFT_1915048 [Mycena galericulata]